VTELALLRRYEPVVRFTRGESFYPCAVDGFVQLCAMWSRGREEASRLLVPTGELDLQRLAEAGERPSGEQVYLRFVPRPPSAGEYQRWRHAPGRDRLEAPGRLARVPLLSRMLDSGFDLSLLVRGNVPGGSAAAAEIRYRELCAADGRHVYYGRVVEEGGWIVLQYLFFYAMNNWRSGFHGTNDHEADWEQIFVYLSANGASGEPTPAWAAYASHDFRGDDVRRRWDDPDLIREGDHPVVFAGAGSHASYFEAGEYVMSVEPRFLTPVKHAAITLRRLWAERLGQGASGRAERTIAGIVAVPFIDYARGDGLRVGPGGDVEWTPVVIGDGVPWVDRYHGLWGLDTRDPFGGERAPSGPKYNRDGSVRWSWYDPVGWAGLDKVLPASDVPSALEARQHQLGAERAELTCRIGKARAVVRELTLDDEALDAAGVGGAPKIRTRLALTAANSALRDLEERRAGIGEVGKAIQARAMQLRRGDSGDPHAHLKHPHRPEPPVTRRGALELWAAVSGATALLAFVALLILAPSHWWKWAILTAVAFALVEATVRGRLDDFLLNIVLTLAGITSLVLAWVFWRVAIAVALTAVVMFQLRDNLRELWRR
jgi:hypothetical protein